MNGIRLVLEVFCGCLLDLLLVAFDLVGFHLLGHLILEGSFDLFFGRLMTLFIICGIILSVT